MRDQYLEVLFLFIESAAETHDLYVLNTWREFMADFQEYRLRLLKKEVVKVHLNW